MRSKFLPNLNGNKLLTIAYTRTEKSAASPCLVLLVMRGVNVRLADEPAVR